MLRPPRSGDARTLGHYLADPEVAGMLIHVPLPCGREHAAAWLEGMRSEIRRGEARYYVLERRSAAIGLAGLTGIRAGSAELGYWLGRPFWGRGFMGEAVGRILREAWRLPGLRRIEAVYMADNEASARLLLSAGFGHAGAVKLYSRARGMDVMCRTMTLERVNASAAETAMAAPAA